MAFDLGRMTGGNTGINGGRAMSVGKLVNMNDPFMTNTAPRGAQQPTQGTYTGASPFGSMPAATVQEPTPASSMPMPGNAPPPPQGMGAEMPVLQEQMPPSLAALQDRGGPSQGDTNIMYAATPGPPGMNQNLGQRQPSMSVRQLKSRVY